MFALQGPDCNNNREVIHIVDLETFNNLFILGILAFKIEVWLDKTMEDINALN